MEDLTGRWLKALVHDPQSTTIKLGGFVQVKSMGGCSSYEVRLEVPASGFGADPSKKNLWELMPIGFDPNKSFVFPSKTIAMQNWPCGGTVKEGEIGILRQSSGTGAIYDFPSQSNYSVSKVHFDTGKLLPYDDTTSFRDEKPTDSPTDDLSRRWLKCVTTTTWSYGDKRPKIGEYVRIRSGKLIDSSIQVENKTGNPESFGTGRLGKLHAEFELMPKGFTPPIGPFKEGDKLYGFTTCGRYNITKVNDQPGVYGRFVIPIKVVYEGDKVKLYTSYDTFWTCYVKDVKIYEEPLTRKMEDVSAIMSAAAYPVTSKQCFSSSLEDNPIIKTNKKLKTKIIVI